MAGKDENINIVLKDEDTNLIDFYDCINYAKKGKPEGLTNSQWCSYLAKAYLQRLAKDGRNNKAAQASWDAENAKPDFNLE